MVFSRVLYSITQLCCLPFALHVLVVVFIKFISSTTLVFNTVVVYRLVGNGISAVKITISC